MVNLIGRQTQFAQYLIRVATQVGWGSVHGAGCLCEFDWKAQHVQGAVLGVVGMVVGYFWWLGLATAIAGGYGFNRFRRLPR